MGVGGWVLQNKLHLPKRSLQTNSRNGNLLHVQLLHASMAYLVTQLQCSRTNWQSRPLLSSTLPWFLSPQLADTPPLLCQPHPQTVMNIVDRCLLKWCSPVAKITTGASHVIFFSREPKSGQPLVTPFSWYLCTLYTRFYMRQLHSVNWEKNKVC